ncbi:MAG: DUF1501 domain-containing protein [SAR202 cluster bacterium]|nr:hypothetical protein [Chloroflexota bacterium]MQF96424.1 DUF1501 domain-containing protein [SAR202 cluster bacterium]HAA95967.1 hypothetical protein [Dehalococcoidia bacterium]MBO19756.1 hypothetical protein [Chloroflexota bacterium]MQG34205.1 DUF1501 domain-containing protein [SAR202 cluster bacterium]|tara:strand:- start:22912 stop:24048 length:1137 start_codon:yes stop_codon:yes gene_type:complete
MTTNKKDTVLVVLQMSGAYDALNTFIPYNDPHYKDYRQLVTVEPEDVLAVDDKVGFHPAMTSIKDLYDEGKVAVIQGIGYPNPIRSHFRSMDIWHTAEPAKMGMDGWLGRAVRELDPNKENVLTAVNFGRGLPRALASSGVSVASVGSLDSLGVLTGIDSQDQRTEALDIFARMYSPMIGSGPANDYLSQTGLDVLKGSDILSTAPGKYSSTVEYAGDQFSQWCKNIAQVHLGDYGTRVLYTGLNPGTFDTHANQTTSFPKLWGEVSNAVGDLYQDLKEHNAEKEVVMLLFTEFGRRVQENGSGTDHGSGSVAFVVGDQVNGGLYGEYPSLEPDKLDEGDLRWNNDFRSTYATLLEQWLGLDSQPILNGSYEQFDFIK